MASFESRVRELVQEELRDVYRLFQDVPGLANEGKPVELPGNFEPTILGRISELKDEVRNIERLLQADPNQDDADEPEDGSNDPEMVRKRWKRIKRIYKWVYDNFIDGAPGVDSAKDQVLSVLDKVVDVPATMVNELTRTIVNAMQHSQTRGRILWGVNKLQSELQVIAGKLARVSPLTIEALNDLLNDKTLQVIESVKESSGSTNDLINTKVEEVKDEIKGIDRNVTVIGKDMQFAITDLYSKMIAGGVLSRTPFRFI